VALTWYVCDLKTGVVLNTLPLHVTGTVERTVGAPSTLGVRLDVHDARCPADWEALLDKRRTMLVLDDDGAPLVGYRIVFYTPGEPELPITLKSLESIPERTFCRDHEFYESTPTVPGTDEADVAAALLYDEVVPGWGFELLVTQTGKTADHSYTFQEDRTVASALADLMDTEGGPEWTIRLRWESPAQRRIIKTIQIGPRVGDVLPSTIIDNKYLDSRKRVVSADVDDLAVRVIATSDGSGSDRPMSDPWVDQDALDAGVPPWEARVHVTGVEDPAQLDRVAEAGLRQRWNGVTTWELVLASTEEGCPRPGRDFDAGDTVVLQSKPTAHDPAAWDGSARLIGWRADVVESAFRTVTPVFWEDKEVGAA
jgi:hypothetical protein